MKEHMGFLLEKNKNGNYSIVEFLKNDFVDVQIPNNCEGIPIDTIKSLSFLEKSSIEKIRIPDTIKTIEKNAFVYLSSLTDVFISNYYYNLSELFQDCPIDICMIVKDNYYEDYKNDNEIFCFFKSIEYASQQLGIGFVTDKNNVLKITENYQTLYIPDGIKAKLYNREFKEVEYVRDNKNNIVQTYNIFKKLLGAKISNGLREIPIRYFSGTDIRFVNINEEVNIINHHAFANCKKLKKVELTDNIFEIDKYVFYNTPFLSELENNSKKKKNKLIIYDNIVLGCNSFYCEELKELIIPENITAIASSSIRLPVEKIVLNKKLKRISERAFYDCIKLKEVFIPKNIEYIGDYAFGYDGFSHEREELNIIYEDNVKIKADIAENAFTEDKTLPFN